MCADYSQLTKHVKALTCMHGFSRFVHPGCRLAACCELCWPACEAAGLLQLSYGFWLRECSLDVNDMMCEHSMPEWICRLGNEGWHSNC